MNLLILATTIFLVLGLFKPQASLFWYPKDRTRVLSAVIYGGILFILVGVTTTQKEETPATDTASSKFSADTVAPQADTAVSQATARDPQQLAENRVKEKLKAKAEEDWPNDYSTQEYWINKEMEDYRYMRTIPEGGIKRQAERDWPYDYSTQKYWYNQQLAARARLND